MQKCEEVDEQAEGSGWVEVKEGLEGCYAGGFVWLLRGGCGLLEDWPERRRENRFGKTSKVKLQQRTDVRYIFSSKGRPRTVARSLVECRRKFFECAFGRGGREPEERGCCYASATNFFDAGENAGGEGVRVVA